MDTRAALRALFAAAALFMGSAQATETEPVPVPVQQPQDSEEIFGRAAGKVEEATQRAYLDAVAAFDAGLQQAPGDIELAVARCRFFQMYSNAEYGNWIAEAEEAFPRCSQELRERWPNVPQVVLFELERSWGEDAAARGEAIIKSAEHWPDHFRRDLLAKTSQMHDLNDNKTRGGELALMAVQLGDNTRVGAAARYLAEQKKLDEAAVLLAKAAPAELPNDAGDRVEAALALPDTKAALAQLRRQPEMVQFIDAEIAARAYMRAGDFASAQRVLKDKSGNYESIKTLKFDAALGNRDFAGAAKIVNLADRPHFAIHLARFATLAMAAPITLLQPSMMQGAMICIAWFMVMVLVPGVVLVPAHYRGLARRLQGKVGSPLFPAIGLWRAWYAAAVAITVPTAVLLLVQPSAMAEMASGNVTDASQMFRAFLFAETTALLFLIPALVGMNRHQLIGDRTTLRTWWIVLLMWGALISIGVVLGWLQILLGFGGETAQTRMVAAMAEGGAELGGPLLSLLILAMVGPVFEELAFRGLLLGGLSRHISFGWANTIQALIFAAIHNDSPRFLYYFAMGLFGGWLVKRTGSLGATIALHVLNNAVAVGALLWVG